MGENIKLYGTKSIPSLGDGQSLVNALIAKDLICRELEVSQGRFSQPGTSVYLLLQAIVKRRCLGEHVDQRQLQEMFFQSEITVFDWRMMHEMRRFK